MNTYCEIRGDRGHGGRGARGGGAPPDGILQFSPQALLRTVLISQKVFMQKSIPTQIRQLIIYIDGFVRELTFAKHFYISSFCEIRGHWGYEGRGRPAGGAALDCQGLAT